MTRLRPSSANTFNIQNVDGGPTRGNTWRCRQQREHPSPLLARNEGYTHRGDQAAGTAASSLACRPSPRRFRCSLRPACLPGGWIFAWERPPGHDSPFAQPGPVVAADWLELAFVLSDVVDCSAVQHHTDFETVLRKQQGTNGH